MAGQPMTPAKKAMLDEYGRKKAERDRAKREAKRTPEPLPIVPPGSAPRFFGYSRVSTQDQADNGTSLERQETNLRKVWDLSFTETHEWYGVLRDEAVSGAGPIAERPQGKRLLLSVQKGDTIAFSALDRAFRNLADGINTMTDLDKRGVTVIILNLPGSGDGRPSPVNFSSPMGRLMMQILMAFGEFERHTIKERTHAALRERQKRDPWSSITPYGMKRQSPNSKFYVPDVRHREFVRLVAKVAEETGIALQSFYLRHELKDRGIYWYKRERRGGWWADDDKPPTYLPSAQLLGRWVVLERRAQAKEAAGMYIHKRGSWRQKLTTTPAEAAAGVVDLQPATEAIHAHV